MARKASAKSTLNALQQTLTQNVVVDLMRAAIQRGVSAAELGTELMAQGYAITSSMDLADARKAVAGMLGGATGARTASGRKAAVKGRGKKPARKPAAKRGAARRPASRAARRGKAGSSRKTR